MDIQVVRSFLTVERMGSVTAAARELNFSQPAITAHIHTFERLVGGPVLERSRSGTVLTPLGASLVERATRLLAEYDTLMAEAHDASGAGTRLVVGFAPTSMHGYVEQLARAAARALPRVRLVLVPLERPAQIEHDLLTRLMDLQVVPGPITDPRLVSRALHPIRVGVRATAGHALARLHRVPLEAILDLPIQRLDGVPLEWDRSWCAWAARGGPPVRTWDVDTFAACARPVQDPRAVVICPGPPLIKEPPGDVWRPLVGAGRVWMELAHRAGDARPAVRAVALLLPVDVPCAQGGGACTTLSASVPSNSCIG